MFFAIFHEIDTILLFSVISAGFLYTEVVIVLLLVLPRKKKKLFDLLWP